MSETRAYLRVAHPLATWGGWQDPAEAVAAADSLAQDRTDWSLFLGDSREFARMVLGAFHGWRTGPGPLHSVGYLGFNLAELALTAGELRQTPDHYTHKWPRELADAHHDLVGHTLDGVRALLDAVAFNSRLVRLTRVELYVEEQKLAQRADCVRPFAELAQNRFRKLRKNDPSTFSEVHAACTATGVPPPAP